VPIPAERFRQAGAMAWRDWRVFAWLDRLDERFDELVPAGPDRAAQAQPYSNQPVLAASTFGPNLPYLMGGSVLAFIGLFWLIVRWRAVRRGEAPAERFVLAVTEDELLILRTRFGGHSVKAPLDAWSRDDIVASRIETWRGRAIIDGFAVSVENRRLGRRFEARSFSRSDEAGNVIRLLVGA